MLLESPTVPETSSRWHDLAARVLAGESATGDEALAILQSADDDLLDLVAAAARLRRRYFGQTVQLYFLMNAKSGLCAEDCGYCSQSKESDAEIPTYNFLSAPRLLEGARRAAEQRAKTYCIVISGRAPTDRELRLVTDLVPQIKQQFGLNICACLGLLDADQARLLKECGVDKVNHNLNTSARFYPEICSTHTHADRLETLRNVRNAGLQICSGGIIGMGETLVDRVQMALELRELRAESIPLNFLINIEGAPIGHKDELTPRDCLRALCMMRFVNPASELRIAGGREQHLGALQPLGLHVANSIFIGDYLTTKGQAAAEDYRMIRELGFTVTVADGQPVDLPDPAPRAAEFGIVDRPAQGV
ncbi:MAG: biotin synthase BioB [Pirellulales bacterium]|nr:biotin synthase BioB [Pirellulales bacterium]